VVIAATLTLSAGTNASTASRSLGVAGNIVAAWVLTLPAAGAVAAAAYFITHALVG